MFDPRSKALAQTVPDRRDGFSLRENSLFQPPDAVCSADSDPFVQTHVASDRRLASVYQQDVPGNPAVGSVLHLGQLHLYPGVKDDVPAIGDYQFAILQELNRRNIKHVFVEDAVEPDTNEWRKKERAQGIRAEFAHGVPSSMDLLTDSQRRTLAASGAAEVYAAMNPDVELHQTDAERSYKRGLRIDQRKSELSDRLSTGKISQEQFDREQRSLDRKENNYIFDFRERLTTTNIQQFLSTHQGETVALVYGSAHQFEPKDFRRNQCSESFADLPLVGSLRWPLLAERLPTAAAARIRDASDPEQQLSLIKDAEQVSESVLPFIRSEEGMLAVLGKLVPRPDVYENRAQATGGLSYLCSRSVVGLPLSVRLKIQALRFLEQGPFARYDAKPLDENQIKRMSSGELQQLILDEKDVATQREIIRLVDQVPLDAFPFIRSRSGQMLALPKLVTSARQHAMTAEFLRDYLMIYKSHPTVADAIEQHYQEKRGPFSGLRSEDTKLSP